MKSLVLMTGSVMANEYNCSSGWIPIWGGTHCQKQIDECFSSIYELFKKRFNDVQDYANKLKKGLQENMIQA